MHTPTPNKKQNTESFIPLLGYACLNRFYDVLLIASGLGSTFRERITMFGNIPPDTQTILDVGCGTGTHARLLAHMFPQSRVIGIDPDREIIHTLNKQYARGKSNLSFCVGTAEHLPVKEGVIDFCFSTLVFHHLSTTAKKNALTEIHRALKPGGTFVLVDWGISPIPFMKHLLIFERKELLTDHFLGHIPHFAHDAGFTLTKSVRMKPSGIWAYHFHT